MRRLAVLALAFTLMAFSTPPDNPGEAPDVSIRAVGHSWEVEGVGRDAFQLKRARFDLAEGDRVELYDREGRFAGLLTGVVAPNDLPTNGGVQVQSLGYVVDRPRNILTKKNPSRSWAQCQWW